MNHPYHCNILQHFQAIRENVNFRFLLVDPVHGHLCNRQGHSPSEVKNLNVESESGQFLTSENFFACILPEHLETALGISDSPIAKILTMVENTLPINFLWNEVITCVSSSSRTTLDPIATG